jgi:tRNA(Ile)-lysidine synthase
LENGGRQKVKSLLIDRKIPRELRNRVPIFTAGGEIFWVGGVRRAAVALVTAETRHRIVFHMVWDEEKGEEN